MKSKTPDTATKKLNLLLAMCDSKSKYLQTYRARWGVNDVECISSWLGTKLPYIPAEILEDFNALYAHLKKNKKKT